MADRLDEASIVADREPRLPLEAEDYLVELLTRPIPQMDGLRVGCEVEVGENWGEMEGTRAVNLVDDPEWNADIAA